MNEQGSFAAALIGSAASAYAAGALRSLPEAAGAGYSARQVDMVNRIEHLCSALACGLPELFVEHVVWLAESQAARGVPIETLAEQLEALRVELLDSLPGPQAELARVPLDLALERLAGGIEPPRSRLAAGPRAELAQRFLLALLEGRRDDALSLVSDSLNGGLSLIDLQLDVIAPAQAELGRMWQLGELRIAEEHLASTVVSEALGLSRRELRAPDPDARRALVSSVRGNAHDFGARMVVDQFALIGWKTLFLGHDLPEAEIAWTAIEFRADVLALSLALGTQVQAAAQTIAAVKAELPDLPVLVGGPIFARVEGLAEALGADAGAPGLEQLQPLLERIVPAS